MKSLSVHIEVITVRECGRASLLSTYEYSYQLEFLSSCLGYSNSLSYSSRPEFEPMPHPITSKGRPSYCKPTIVL